ncbi:hypothetical protein H2200_002931 [Cladophialophora chaetospira]|uniref:Uncharacterized protein n=1 Tax=Cladophialophora chaetospira TaxID=386627 RepID=A0AA38XGE3_9EURO|nr:hypothetical protein H2200_002931 [Cladophialophora chaetospira]
MFMVVNNALTDLVRSSLQDGTDPNFLLSHWHFTDVTGFWQFDAPCTDGDYWMAMGRTYAECDIPFMVAHVDVFAKSFYNTVLTDLGQNNSNLLADRSILEYLQDLAGMDLNRTTEAYNLSLQNLKVTPATLFMQYECAVPVLKGMGSVIISVLLADLVFLQALWFLLNLGCTWWLQKHDPLYNYCSGCQKSRGIVHSPRDTSGVNPLS